MNFYPGFDIRPILTPMGFLYGKEVFGPPVEFRNLDAIRHSLLDSQCQGPDPVYAIAMDVGKVFHLPLLKRMNLLYGAVTYTSGKLGNEPVRSQGHVHKKTRTNTLSPPEIYEIWTGSAIILMQEYVGAYPGRCYALEAGPGEIVVVPPDWAHATISADPENPLCFGAWCDRDYGFEYEDLKTLKGLAWFPVFTNGSVISWKANPNYLPSKLIQKKPGDYSSLGLRNGIPIYTQFEQQPETFLFVSNPEIKAAEWKKLEP